jgi:hypothetical protein
MVPENKQNRRYKQINFIGLQNNRHPSQHNVDNVYKASGNCQQSPRYESIAEPLAGARSGEYGGLLFPRLKSIMKGARFADVAAIQDRVTVDTPRTSHAGTARMNTT